ncbi:MULTISPECIES: pyruvate, water dikinase regulatory protein [Megasphaera]|uniref:Putative pyruvate, phosphate dikinase regulatory protein n=1 Tax=Megasphaera vaginalis (ex Srinivasan et al. 2021) TaxID=1111454 RepID=U7UDD4_9FIRM|nr:MULTISPECIES: pyruvate, water dikinase regulatory protein [Megasphaera]ERT56463.1 kinase/pyrophosphorylase [Megasphaera vaginalis (ex Srinivasan et al. 2021)]
MPLPIIYACSDSLGDTAERVARAAASQYDQEKFNIIRVPYIRSEQQIEELVKKAATAHAMICYTVISPTLRRKLQDMTANLDIPVIDIIGPMLAGVGSIAGTEPTLRAGMIHQLDKEYFRRVDAIEFAVKFDDGKNPLGFLKADVVIIGVSRTSKTPLSMYLAHKRIKAANLPLVPEVALPQELFEIPARKIVGLVIDPFKLNFIRSERLRAMGLEPNASYANVERINEELEYARGVMRRLHCPVIDVSSKAIEETANLIMDIVKRNADLYEDE